jgi:hypothetical protein
MISVYLQKRKPQKKVKFCDDRQLRRWATVKDRNGTAWTGQRQTKWRNEREIRKRKLMLDSDMDPDDTNHLLNAIAFLSNGSVPSAFRFAAFRGIGDLGGTCVFQATSDRKQNV